MPINHNLPDFLRKRRTDPHGRFIGSGVEPIRAPAVKEETIREEGQITGLQALSPRLDLDRSKVASGLRHADLQSVGHEAREGIVDQTPVLLTAILAVNSEREAARFT